MALTVYHYPNCSTCKKALAWLAAHRIAYTAVDIVKSPPSKAELQRAAKLAGVPVAKLFNVSGVSYREGDYKTKLATMTDAQAFAALAADGKLIKRPLAVAVAASDDSPTPSIGLSARTPTAPVRTKTAREDRERRADIALVGFREDAWAAALGA